MNMVELSLIALALALDAAFYAFSYGLLLRSGRLWASLRLALVVGLFQGLMPLLGYTFGLPLRDILHEWVPSILLLVFGGLGTSMIYQSWWGNKGEEEPVALGRSSVLLVGGLTSIDALALGACMSLSPIAGVDGWASLGLACAVIAAVTFALSLLFFHATLLFYKLPTRVLESLAGLILLGLGLQGTLQN
ncbi:MAG: manganese efflux pump [Akkermansia sp.]